MPSANSLFLCCFCCRKLLLEIFTELDENLRRFFIEEMRTGARRATSGGTPSESHPGSKGGGVAASTRPWPSETPSRCTLAYKLPPTKNPRPRRIFLETEQSSAAIADKFRGSDCSCSGTLPGRGSTSGAIFIAIAASRDEEGVFPHRG